MKAGPSQLRRPVSTTSRLKREDHRHIYHLSEGHDCDGHDPPYGRGDSLYEQRWEQHDDAKRREHGNAHVGGVLTAEHAEGYPANSRRYRLDL